MFRVIRKNEYFQLVNNYKKLCILHKNIITNQKSQHMFEVIAINVFAPNN